MGNFLYQIGLSLLDIGIKRILMGAGLGLFSYTALKKIFEQMISQGIGQMQGGGSVALAFLGMSGMDTALSIVISAALIRVTIASTALHIVKT